MKIFHRFIATELLRTFFIVLSLFLFIVLMDRASFIASTILGQGVGFKDFLSVLIKTIPSFLGIVIPISFVIGVLLVFTQMGMRNEIVAFKSCGVGVKELSKPVILLGLLFSALSFFSLMFLAPKSKVAVKKEIEELLRKKITMNITPKSFSSNFPGITFYVDKVFPEKGYIFNFMVAIQKEPKLITLFGEKGLLRTKGDSVFLDVFNGSAQIVDWKKPEEFKHLTFKSYTIELYTFSKKERFNAQKYKTLFQLLREKSTESISELFKRLSLSFAPLIMGILAFSVGVSLPRGAVGLSVVSGLLMIVAYYVLYTFSKKMAVKLSFPPLALLPDAVFLLIALPAYILAVKERLKIEEIAGKRW